MPRKGKGTKFWEPPTWDLTKIRESSEEDLLVWLKGIAPQQKVKTYG